MPYTDSFDKFKTQLAHRLNTAQSMGASRGTILNAAKNFSEYLSHEVDPSNPEQRLLKELWDVADDSEQNSLVNMLVKFVDKEGES